MQNRKIWTPDTQSANAAGDSKDSALGVIRLSQTLLRSAISPAAG
jgi:hypothetical protein